MPKENNPADVRRDTPADRKTLGNGTVQQYMVYPAAATINGFGGVAHSTDANSLSRHWIPMSVTSTPSHDGLPIYPGYACSPVRSCGEQSQCIQVHAKASYSRLLPPMCCAQRRKSPLLLSRRYPADTDQAEDYGAEFPI